jgi:serine/threonine protein kinase
MGTAAYMSPEQARGKPVDKRADIWAFGCVLFECLTGKQTFAGETVSDILASVLRAEPDWAALPPDLADGVNELLRRCLVRNPVDRLRDVGDARITLDRLGSPRASATTEITSPAKTRRRRVWMALLIPLALTLTALMTAAVVLDLRPTDQLPLRKSLLLGPGHKLDPEVVPRIFPDGTKVVYSSEGHLWIRSLARFDSRPVPNSGQAHAPFWSPDGDFVAFF